MALHTNKDKQMAAHLKAIGDERKVGRCPICYAIVANARMYDHIAQHSYGSA